MTSNLIDLDGKYIWHPYTSLHQKRKPIAIVKGKGTYLIDSNKQYYLDAISSWWVNIHGHNHPYIMTEMKKQLDVLDHCIFADFTHEPAVLLAQRLLSLLPGNMARIFYSDNGSTAVEVALKMAWQYHQNRKNKVTKIIAFSGAYHGDTFGAMSVSERGIFTKVFRDLLFSVDFVDFPQQKADYSSVLNQLEILLKSQKVAAFIVEPLVQGAAGMRMYPADFLAQIFLLCKQYGVLIIADEVMTGFGRTGTYFACDKIKTLVTPDIICLSKGLTGGVLPLGVTACSNLVLEAFESQSNEAVFYHGHSFTANPIACSAALASLDLLLQKACKEQIQNISLQQKRQAETWGNNVKIRQIRSCGTILALELVIADEKTSYLHNKRDFIYDFFLDRKIILRPLGNVVYIMPPYCIKKEELVYIYEQIEALLEII